MSQILGTVLADPTVGAIGLAIGGALAGIWLAATWWTYADMSRRTHSDLARLSAATWVLLSTPVLLPLSLGSYLLARPQLTLAERRAVRLFGALAPTLNEELCPSCQDSIDAGWSRCPGCAFWLKTECQACGEWSTSDVDVCPFCARDKIREVALTDQPEADETATVRVVAADDSAVTDSDATGSLPSRSSRPRNPGARVRRTDGAGRSAGSVTVRAGS